MRRYETIFISNPDLSETERGQVFERTKNLISEYNGTLFTFDEWGSKKLAYDIKKKNRGYYVRIDYCGNGDLVDEMERSFRIDDRVLKFMTIVIDKKADPEAILLELSKEKEKTVSDQATDEESEATDTADSSEKETVETEDV